MASEIKAVALLHCRLATILFPFFLLRKVMKSLRTIRRHSYDKKRSTIRWMKQTQLQLKLSPVKTKAIQTWTCIRLLLQWGTHSGVSAESALRGIEDRTASVVLIMSSAWRKFTQRRTTARSYRSTTVAVDLPLFARLFLQLLVLDGIERLFEHDQAPSECLPYSNKWVETFCFSPLALFCPVDGSFIHHCLYIFYKFSQFRAAIEVAEQPPNKRRRNSLFLVNRWKLTPSFRCLSACCSRKRNRRPFSASPSNSVDCVTHAIRSIVAPFKSHGIVNSRKSRHGEWTCSTKISRT